MQIYFVKNAERCLRFDNLLQEQLAVWIAVENENDLNAEKKIRSKTTDKLSFAPIYIAC